MDRNSAKVNHQVAEFYKFDEYSQCWVPRDKRMHFSYSDGDEVEQRIGNIITQASDISVLSLELRHYCTDWPSLYHLSSSRANILRPFEPYLRGNILEIGAGCGAITRYLGECGASVLALEGSLRRAAIARSRTRDLENVVVVSDNFDHFQSTHQFDVITLIGVLEYANLFIDHGEPALAMLQRIRSLLKPDGKLIIAIENQLGLKYLAGAPEDHLGKPMYGIEGRYQSDQPQTFGRVILKRMLKDADFPNADFLAPFPDYKLPVSILTEQGALHENFDAAALAWQSVKRDPQLPVSPNFSLELAWPQIFKNRLAIDLSNSFLIVASPSEQSLSQPGILAYHYSTERQPQFCKESLFVERETGQVDVQCRPLRPFALDNHAIQHTGISFKISESNPYTLGKPLAWEFLEIVTRPGWAITDINGFLKRYICAVQAIASKQGLDAFRISGNAKLPGHFFDLLPQNIIVSSVGEFQSFDYEWIAQSNISLDFLVFRGLFVSLGSISRCAKPANDELLEWKFFIQQSAASCGIAISDENYLDFLAREIEFRKQVTGMPSGTRDVLLSYKLPTLFLDDDEETAVERMLAERNKAIEERDAALECVRFLRNTNSWKLTRPLRLLRRTMQHGLSKEDSERIVQRLRHRYHQLPDPIKRVVRFAYRDFFGRLNKVLRRKALRNVEFIPPSIQPAMQRLQTPDYVVWGVIDWHFRHQRPQQLALALAGTGRRVFYISPNFVDDERAGFVVESIDGSGLLFQVRLFVRDAPSIYSSAPGTETVRQLRHSIGETMNWTNSSQIVSLVQHPFWYDVASVLPNSRLVYDCIDHHQGFGNNASSLLKLEESLLSNAALTITTSTWLDEFVAPHAKRRVLIRNAGDYDHFAGIPDSIYRDPAGRKIIGYYGAIAEWFDLDLIAAVAEQHPDCCVLLIGEDSVGARARLGDLPNVAFTGEVPYGKLPYYLHSFEVCLLPFKVIPLTLATNPVKVYEYLSSGKPVVAVDLPEMAQFDGLLHAAGDREHFLEAVKNVLTDTEPEELAQRRKIFAREQTWKHRTDVLIQHAESSDHEPKVSVIVVTFNNLELTRACLASLREHSHYTNLEIIVVDNASKDGTPDFLKAWASDTSNQKLILNNDNLGFAAANNQGMDIATGEYLVLLNNDTYVTHGWIRTLIHHLERDKSIGLIGPVTNNIGNEAKIDIGYKNMEEMLVKSLAYTRRHIGQTFALRTAAFFCVMIPRTTYERVGKLDEAFGRGFFEDDDYCRRIEQLGLHIVCAEDVFIHHHLSASFNKLKYETRQKLFEENKKIYEEKWGKWIPHNHRNQQHSAFHDRDVPEAFANQQSIEGRCIVCNQPSRFFYREAALWRESLICEHCRTTSRYRAIALGILKAIHELTGEVVSSLATLPRVSGKKLSVYDTQLPFYYIPCAYPLPDFLKKTGWIDVKLSQFKPHQQFGKVLSEGVTNQNLECLTFADNSLDIVITSDVMEHVRLDERAHQEIYRVLKPGGIYVFTVPHHRDWTNTLIRVQVTDPEDPSKDIHLLEPEYHGDTNGDASEGILAYRTYGRDIEDKLANLGFVVKYDRYNNYNYGILNTELYFCQKKIE